MRTWILIVLVVLSISLLSDVSSALPIMYGFALNSSDSADANGREVAMWQPSHGKTTNQTDTIGVSGASATANYWLIDCFDDPPTNNDDCDLGDVLKLEIIEDSNNYTSNYVTVTITSDMITNGIGEAPNITLTKSLGPNITVRYPIASTNISGDWLVNVTVKNKTIIDVDKVRYSLKNSSGYYSSDGQPGWTTLARWGSTNNFNDSFDTTLFANGNYTLYITANNTKRRNTTIASFILNISNNMGYTIESVPSGYSFVLASDTSINLSVSPQQGVHASFTGNNGTQRFAARLNINFSNTNINVSQITMGISTYLRKAFIHNYSGIPGVVNASLLVPKINNSGGVYICPNASSLSHINKTCPNMVEIDSGKTVLGMTVSEVVIDGKNYYEITGISGTGSGENENAKLVVWDDGDAKAGSKTIFTNQNILFYANFTNRTNQSYISGADAGCKIKFNLTSGWEGYYDMMFDSSSKLYSFERNFNSTNGTFLFNVKCNATDMNYDVVNANDTFTLTYSYWHILYGATGGNISLGFSNSDVIRWGDLKDIGNVYAADADSKINWNMLRALGRKLDFSESYDDFEDIDKNLGLGNKDNVSFYWLNSSNEPKALATFTIFTRTIENVSYVNSTNSSDFITGILWDASDDESSNGQYDQVDKEDLVFVARVANATAGKYGVYDYEIKVPANLNTYKAGTSAVDFYVELS